MVSSRQITDPRSMPTSIAEACPGNSSAEAESETIRHRRPLDMAHFTANEHVGQADHRHVPAFNVDARAGGDLLPQDPMLLLHRSRRCKPGQDPVDMPVDLSTSIRQDPDRSRQQGRRSDHAVLHLPPEWRHRSGRRQPREGTGPSPNGRLRAFRPIDGGLAARRHATGNSEAHGRNQEPRLPHPASPIIWPLIGSALGADRSTSGGDAVHAQDARRMRKYVLLHRPVRACC